MSAPAASGPKRAGLYAAVALAAAVLIGGSAGYAIGRWQAARPRPLAVTLLGVSRATLLDSLDLSAEQRARIEDVLTGAEVRANASVDVMVDEVRAATDEARREVRALLSESQRVRFDSILSTAAPLRPRAPVPPRSGP